MLCSLPSNSLVGKLLHTIKLLLHVASLVSFFLQVRKKFAAPTNAVDHPPKKKRKKKLRYVAAIVLPRPDFRPLLVTKTEQFSWLNPVTSAVTVKTRREVSRNSGGRPSGSPLPRMSALLIDWLISLLQL